MGREEISHDTDTVPEMTFMNLATILGASTVRGVIEQARTEWEKGTSEGGTYSSEGGTITLTVVKGAVNFKLGDWEPQQLPLYRAEELLSEFGPPPDSNQIAS